MRRASSRIRARPTSARSSGFGFAPFTGGTLSYIDGMGVANFVLMCDALRTKHGDRFTVPPMLIDMAKDNETFYGRFKAEKARAAVAA